MDWGEWEGATLADLRSRHSEEFRANEQRGWDFRPAGGESPREVLARVRAWIEEVSTRESSVAAVTHKGVLRALFAAATGWDMLGKPPQRLLPGCLHRFAVDESQRLSVVECNIALATREFL